MTVGRITEVVDPSQPGTPRVLAHFAACITATHAAWADEIGAEYAATITHDLLVVWTDANDVRRDEVLNDIPDSLLADDASPRVWLRRLKLGRGSAIIYTRSAGEQINNAIRNHDSGLVQHQEIRATMGWEMSAVHGALYRHAGGAIGEHGETGASRAALAVKAYRAIEYPDPAALPEGRELEAAVNALAISRELNPNLWGVGFGIVAHAIAALGVGVTGFVLGSAGCGKTTGAGVIASFQSPIWRPRVGAKVMAKVDATQSVADRIGAGLDCAFVTVDDARQMEGRKAEMQSALLDVLIRRGYGGASEGNRKSKKDDATGNWTDIESDSNPAVLIIGERYPAGLIKSALERTIPIRLTHENAFVSGTSARVEELCATNLPQQFTAFLLRYLAGEINRAGGLDEWRIKWRNEAELLRGELSGHSLSERQIRSATVPIIGSSIVRGYFHSLGLLTADEVASDDLKLKAEIVKTLIHFGTHGELGVAGRPEHDDVLDGIRTALITDAATLIDVVGVANAWQMHISVDDRATAIGAFKKVEGVTMVALLPEAMATLAVFRGTPYSNHRAIESALAPIAIGGQRGSSKRQVRIGGQTVRALFIDANLMFQRDAEADVE